MQLRSLVVVTSLAVAASCAPTNPFDPASPSTLQAKAQVDGVVHGKDGGTLDGVAVTLFADGALGATLDTGSDGRFTFKDLVPGAYSLSFAHPTHVPTTLALNLAAGEHRTLDVALADLGATGPGTGQLSGVVEKEGELSKPTDQQDHSGIIVAVENSDVRTLTDIHGAWQISLLPGHYTVDFSFPGHTPQTASGDVTDGHDTVIDTIVLAATPGTIAGTVALEDGASPEGALISVVGLGDTATAAADGSFQLTVAAGVPSLTIAKDGYVTATIASVVVDAGNTTNLPTTTLAIARGSITGRIDLVGRSDDSGVAVGITGTTFTAITSDSGAFALNDIPVGTYEVTAERDGFLRGVLSSVVVTADAPDDIGTLQLAQRIGDFDINGGALFTNDPVVTLTLDNPDAAFFEASEDSTFADATQGDTTFQPMAAHPSFTIAGGDGEHIVFVMFQDSQGVVSGPFSSSITLDTIAPAPPLGTNAIAINGGAAFSNDANGVVTIALTATDATSGVATMQLATDASFATAGAFQPFATSTVFSLTAGVDGPRQVFVRFADAAGNVSPAFNASIVLDRAVPVINSVTINSGAGFTTSPLIEVAIDAVDALAGVSRMELSTTGSFSADATSPFATPQEFFLTPGDGTRSVFVKVFDAAGNASDVVSASIVVDTSAPSGTAVSINGGALNTNNANVTLALAATGATKMRVSLDGVLDSEPLQTFAGSLPVTLPSGDGPKLVLAQFFDDANNASGIASASIVLDTTAPTTPLGQSAVTINGGAQFSNDATGVVTLSLAATDATTGVASMQLSTDGALDTEPFVPFQNTLVFTLGGPGTDGPKSVLVRFKDAAGNIGPASTPATITLDRAVPSVSSLAINGNAQFTTSSVVTLTIAASDAGSGVAQMALSTSPGFPVVNFEPFATSRTFVLDPGDGARSVSIEVKDAAGNVSGVVTKTITVDTIAPQQTSVTIDAGASLTNNATASLALNAIGATKMRISTDGVFDTEPTVTFATTATATLPAGDGLKTVTVQFLDDAGNASIASSSIILDQTAPTGATVAFVPSTPGGSFLTSTTATVLVGGSGASKMKLQTVETTSSCGADPAINLNAAPLVPFASTATVTVTENQSAPNVSGGGAVNRCKYAQLQLFDDAGNSTTPIQVKIELDDTAPDAPSIQTSSQVVDLNTIQIVLGANANDVHLSGYQLKNGGATFAAISPVDGTCIGSTTNFCKFNISLVQNQENHVELRAVDVAGNVSASDFVAITEDSTAPTAPATIALRPSDGEITVSWPNSVSTDVAGYKVLYGFNPSPGSGCVTSPSAYAGAFADQGPSPIDVGLANSFQLTGLSNNIELCVALVAYDKTSVPGPHVSTSAVAGAVTPSEIGLQQIATLSATQLGIDPTSAVRAFAVRDGLLYAAVSGTGGGLLELDVTNENCFAQQTASTFTTCTGLVKGTISNNGTPFHDARAVVLHGGFAFVADADQTSPGGTPGVHVFKIVEGSAPQFVLTIPLAGGVLTQRAMSLAVAQNTLVVGRSSTNVRTFDGRADIYNLSPLYAASPAQPTFVTNIAQDGSFGDPGAGIEGFTSVAIQDNVVAAGATLFSINSLSPSTVTKLAAQCSVGHAAVTLQGRTLYMANDDNGLDNNIQDCDLSSGSPHTVGATVNGKGEHRLVASGPYLYVAGQQVLEVYDISTRLAMRFLAQAKGTSGANCTNGFNDDAVLGDVGVDGHRVFYSAGCASTIQVFHTGDPAQLEAVSSEGVPDSGLDARLLGDALVQPNTNAFAAGNAPEAEIKLGQSSFTLEGTSPIVLAPGGNATILEDDRIVFLTDTVENSGAQCDNEIDVTARQISGATLAAHSIHAMPAGLCARSALLRWPYLIITASNGAAGNTTTAQVMDLRSGAIASSQTVATMTAGRSTGFMPSGIAEYGGQIFMAVDDGQTIAADGVYRMSFNPGTGALGAPAEVLSTANVVQAQAYGRRLWMANNSGTGARGMIVQSLASASVNPFATTNLTPIDPAAATFSIAGPTAYIAIGGSGMELMTISFDPTSFQPTSMSTVTTFDLAGNVDVVQATGARLYVGTVSGGWFLFRTR